MKYLFLFLIVFIFSCDACKDRVAEFKKNCPYELNYDGHFLKVPITITPHQLTYSIGDTLTISTIFSDSIEDLGTQQTFKIEGFPFKPITLLYRFYDGMNWDAGYRVNESSVDSIYQPNYNQSNNYADSYRARTLYENGMYKFKLQVVLQETGRYILVFSDKYQSYNGSGNSNLNAEADAITFEGQCPTLPYYLCSMIEGDDHLELFENELVYMDNDVYSGGLGSIVSSIGPLKSGGIAVEFSGFYGFEVVE